MLRCIRLCYAVVLFSIPNSGIAATKELELCAGDIPPFAFQQGESGRGVVYEIVRQLANRVGQRQTITFLPWKRCQTLAQTQKNMAIFPLARTPEREAKYVWIVEVLQDPFALYKVKGSNVDVSTLEAAQKLKVGALLGSPAESLLKAKGFPRVDLVPSEEQNLRKLLHGRIDAWLVASMVAKFTVKQLPSGEASKTPVQLERGIELEVLRQNLAGHPEIDASTVSKWRESFEAMKQDGSYDRIVSSYTTP